MTKNLKVYFIFLLNFSLSIFGQEIMNHYPAGQDAYEGGEVQFYKDFHQILIDKKLTPCENKNELFTLKLVVYEDATIKYVKSDLSPEAMVNNKCAFNLGRDVLKYMDKWKPAVFEGVKKPTITEFIVYPDALFDKYKEGYTAKNFAETATFPGGINAFRQEVAKNIDLNGFIWKEPFKLVVRFVVNGEGKLEDVELAESSGFAMFDERVLDGFKKVKKKWKPATIHREPVKYRFMLPLKFTPPE